MPGWSDSRGNAEEKLGEEELANYYAPSSKEEDNQIYIGSSGSDAAYRKATDLEEKLTGRKEASSGGLELGFAGVAGVIVAGYGLYKVINYIWDKF